MSKSKSYAIRLVEGESLDASLNTLIQHLESNPELLENWREEDKKNRINYRDYSGRKATAKSLVIKRALESGLKLLSKELGV